MKIALETLGCKLNQAETELLAAQFAESGHRLVPSVEEADIYVLNTCTVTHVADAKSRHSLRLAHRRNPEALLVATGCYAQRAPEELARIEGVRLVAGNSEKTRITRILEESGFLGGQESIPEERNANYASVFRTRAFIKIQDGCNSSCAYCIVPLVRGREKSVPADRVVDDVKNRVSAGVKEVVLTGTEIGSYSSDGLDLAGLLERVLTETDVVRLRLSSLQPGEITPGFIRLWSDRRLCPHFHLSLQSGSDLVLGRMKRRYSVDDYREAVSLIRSQVPDAAITTDVIAGFPGETGEEFEESLNFCREMEFARIHVFPYSKRPETAAILLPGQVADSDKTQRIQNLGALSLKWATEYRQGFLGRDMEVLWEKQSGGIWSGYTGNYIKVYTRNNDDLTNSLTQVKLVKLYRDGMWGEIN